MARPASPAPDAAPDTSVPGAKRPPLGTRQRIAQRMSLLLLIELGTGIEVRRMLAQPLYARDVLLVCDAMRGTELARLAMLYRTAEAAEAEIEAEIAASEPPPSLWSGSRSADRLPRTSWLGQSR